MEKHICKICERQFDSLTGLHLHLGKSEKVSQEDYYAKFYPRYDLYSGKLITFKNIADYSEKLFESKATEFAYLTSAGFNLKSQGILKQQIIVGAKKNNNKLPPYCMWRSSKNLRYDKMVDCGIFDKFVSLAKESGVAPSYEYLNLDFSWINKPYTILTDTREQKPLFSGEKTTINVGDYTLSKETYNGVHIDRKSQADFIGTFTNGIDRFKKECEKARAMNIYLIVLVESSFLECFKYLPLKSTKQMVTGENAFYGVRKIIREFDNVQFLFVQDRGEAKEVIPLLLNNKEIVMKYDLQFLYEMGKII